ncbi:MAG: hypothetical protein ACI9T9_000212 [Oleiphilaceae bacterium]|jgi:hypothetical protein
MRIQDISTTNNQKKLLLKAIKDPQILVQEENGDLVVNVKAYLALKNNIAYKNTGAEPIEELIGYDELDFDAEYFVFS